MKPTMETLHPKSVPLKEAPGFKFGILPGFSGAPQVVHMRAQPGAELPVHQHKEGAFMHVTRGVCVVRAAKGDPRNGRILKAGDGVYFGPGEEHGYGSDPDVGFESISINQGILEAGGSHDIDWKQ